MSATEEHYLNYLVQATMVNKSTHLEEILNFFYKENIKINAVNFKANAANQILANLEIQVKVPVDLNILSLRENLLNLCENLNIDSSLEPNY